MRTSRITVALIAAFVLVITVALLWNPFLQSALGLAAEDRVFRSVHIGDTEQRLIGLFDDQGIKYSRDNHDPTAVVYSHGDGFMGVCIYYVEKGRVTVAVKD